MLFLETIRRHGLISKAAFNEGMSPLVLNAYGQAIATIVLVPFAFLLERMTHCSLSLGLFCKIFLAALCGPAASLDFYYMARRYTSATYGTAMLNTIPVVTFIFSVLLSLVIMAHHATKASYAISCQAKAVRSAVSPQFCAIHCHSSCLAAEL
ncbi:WAT1-related protein At5g07050-like [Castanea sativa]|uniref:WAT1-related protein At5g07050-like n=1 Tax=Castanea sativa TaxID=21020 RepID=UPI003F6500C2